LPGEGPDTFAGVSEMTVHVTVFLTVPSLPFPLSSVPEVIRPLLRGFEFPTHEGRPTVALCCTLNISSRKRRVGISAPPRSQIPLAVPRPYNPRARAGAPASARARRSRRRDGTHDFPASASARSAGHRQAVPRPYRGESRRSGCLRGHGQGLGGAPAIPRLDGEGSRSALAHSRPARRDARGCRRRRNSSRSPWRWPPQQANLIYAPDDPGGA